jgi:N-acetylmuramoyl-L-alanine amidase
LPAALRHLLPVAALASLAIAGVTTLSGTTARAASRVVTLGGVRSWSAPTHTRVVFDFSAAVVPIAPDSGVSTELVIAVPGETIRPAPDVPRLLTVGDSVVDVVEIELAPTGGRFRVRFAGNRAFHAFTLPADDEAPFRVVVDVSKPGGAAEQAKELAGIAREKSADRVMVVAVDAGHGGEDAGARGPRGLREKDVVLAIAKATVEEIDRIGGVRAVLTRREDYFIPLRERYQLAERMDADIFISIHANSSRRRGRGNGTEVYFLSLRGASDQAVSDLADLENAADMVGGVPQQSESELVSILYDVKRTSALKQSEVLAEALLDHVASDEGLEARGVKQAGFVVLKSVEFPSALVEVAFINNPEEAKLLNSRAFQQQAAKRIAAGVKEYFDRAGIRLKAENTPGTGTASASSRGN